MIFWETHDKEFDRRVFIRIGREDFKALHANKFVPVLDRYGNPKLDRERNPKFMPLGQAWLTHPTRRTYRSVVCVPNGTVDTDTLNLWTGLAISPAPGDWSLLKAHLLTVICGGDETAYHYLIHWIARALQHPECPGEVAVVLRGLKGAGKGHLGNLLCRLFRQHAVRVDHPRHFTGHFNHHLRDCVFLFADEAHWAGDRQSEGALKGLITEPTIAIERKGKALAKYLTEQYKQHIEKEYDAPVDEKNYALALLVGVVQGGSQALSRSLFASLIPKQRSAEFFGFFAVVEKFAGIFGPWIFARAIGATGSSRGAILAVVGFFIVGGSCSTS